MIRNAIFAVAGLAETTSSHPVHDRQRLAVQGFRPSRVSLLQDVDRQVASRQLETVGALGLPRRTVWARCPGNRSNLREKKTRQLSMAVSHEWDGVEAK